ncbi:hypothetical protein L5515_001960 [Caenorhabditis briggsae]|uniref:Uncharacterized protein n=1 Tax=Caenorhabditis briggsae TaxID=6238 RepID=A0AAE9J484_CAEBR|nr:hypothetical protein L5515_001960 [Caenorhabditis briggsae]
MRSNLILIIVVLVVACFKNDIRKLCWQEFTKSKLCFPKYEKCLVTGKDHAGCRDSFQICIQNGPIYNHTEFCNKYMPNITKFEVITGLEWHQNFLDETLNLVKKKKSQKNDNCDLHSLLFKTNEIPKVSNDFILRMPSLASSYCPCMEKSNGDEVIRTSKINIPIQMWHGGFSSKKCWRELDRFLVEYLCGVSVALDINHAWAKSADCHEDSKQANCNKTFGLALKKSTNMSAVRSTCRLYHEMVEAYLPRIPPLSLDYKMTYINATDIIYMQPFEYQDDRLYLLHSFAEDTYFTCFPVKREVSSCNYIYEHCKLNGDAEKCGDNLVDCLSSTTPIEPSCKQLLIQKNDNLGTLEKIFRYIRNNKLQLAYPVLLYIFWTLSKSIINWALVKMAIKICLKIRDGLDRCSQFIEEKTKEKENTTENEPGQLDPVPEFPTHQITVNSQFLDDAFYDIPLDDYFTRVSSVWIDASESITNDLIYNKENGNLLLALDGYKYNLPNIDLARVDPSEKAIALSEYTPSMNRTESNYLLKKIWEDLLSNDFNIRRIICENIQQLHRNQIDSLAEANYCTKKTKFLPNGLARSAVPTGDFLHEVNQAGKGFIIRMATVSMNAKEQERKKATCTSYSGAIHQMFYKSAPRHHELLMKCGFFDVYLQFDDYRKQKHSKVASWTDGDINLIRDAAEQYFHRLHDLKRGNQESDFICNFEDKDLELGGRSTNTLAFVRIHGEDFVSKFYIKCHHFGPKGTSSGQPPDINELYCYKLLELIAVGPTCHIVPPVITTGTKTSVYIATKWDDNFKLMEHVIQENGLTADLAVQLVLLRVLLFIADLHLQNCGVWKGTNNIAIVDFAPENEITVHDDIKAQLFTTFPHSRWKEEFKAVKNKFDDNSWLKIAKQNLDKWDLSRKLELAQEQLDPTKDVLKGIELGFKKRKLCYSPTVQLKEYVDTLNKNLENLQIVLNSTVH